LFDYLKIVCMCVITKIKIKIGEIKNCSKIDKLLVDIIIA